MRIRDIPLEDRPEIGRKLYEARSAPMTWPEACRAVLSRDDICDTQANSFASWAREYAWKNGLNWPPTSLRWWEMPGAAERVAKRRAKRRARWGAKVRERRLHMKLDAEWFAGLFPGFSVSDLDRVETEGPDDSADYRTLMHVLDRVKAAIDEHHRSRDWLILTDQAA